jgi:hypothetical protein
VKDNNSNLSIVFNNNRIDFWFCKSFEDYFFGLKFVSTITIKISNIKTKQNEFIIARKKAKNC